MVIIKDLEYIDLQCDDHYKIINPIYILFSLTKVEKPLVVR